MIDGNARDFLNKLYYEDHYVVYNGDKYFLNGCQTGYTTDGKKRVKLEVYNLSKDTTVYSVTKSTATECIEDFQDAIIWSGKAFWHAESEIIWVDE